MTPAWNGSKRRAEAGRGAPDEDEPEDRLVVRYPQDGEADAERDRPGGVVHQRERAAAVSEERESPAVLQQESGQRQTEREECHPGRSAEQRSDREHDDARHDAGHCGRPARTCDRRGARSGGRWR